MKNKQEQLKKIKKSSSQEQQSMPYEELIKLIKSLSTEEKIELANSISRFYQNVYGYFKA